MRMKLLITGVSGFIGRSLVEAIVNANLPWDIYGVDIKEPEFQNAIYLTKVTFDKLDIRDEKAVGRYFSENEFDGVVHLAAVSRVIDAENNPEKCVATNYNGMLHVVECVAKHPKTWFVFGSSREVYGEQSVFPVLESAEKKPLNIYGDYKLKGERMVEQMPNPYCILRFSNVYGNLYDIQDRVIPLFVRKALQNEPLILEGGAQIIDFTHISDTVACVVRTIELLQKGIMTNESIHISPGIGNKLTELIECIEQTLNKPVNVIYEDKRDYDVQRFIGDPSKRITLLGERNFISLAEGVKCLFVNSQS